MAHSLVPPTPGPLLVAEEIGVDIGAMMFGGLGIGVFTVGFGYFYAKRVSGKFELKPPQLADSSLIDEKRMPSTFMSLLPVVLPVLLVTGGTLHGIFEPKGLNFLKVLGDKNLALGISALVAFFVLYKSCSGDKEKLKKSSSDAFSSGAVIVIITAAGAAFGGVLKQTDIATSIGSIDGSQALALPVCFIITALVRTAQGSATVAMITAAPNRGSLCFSRIGFSPCLSCACGWVWI